MAYRFQKHYTRDEARALLPQVRAWLRELAGLRDRVLQLDKRIAHLLAKHCDAGGDTVNELARQFARTKSVLDKFTRRDIQIKDLDRGLLDFPAILAGREVFLCWEQDEEDIEFWHELDADYAGRERL